MERKKQVTLSFLNGLFISQTTEVLAGLRLCASLRSVTMYRYVILCKQHVAVGLKPVPLGGLDATFFQTLPSQMGFHADKSRRKKKQHAIHVSPGLKPQFLPKILCIHLVLVFNSVHTCIICCPYGCGMQHLQARGV